jgi:cytochrome b561
VPAPTSRGYGRVAKTFHWLVFALVFAQYVVALAMPDIGRGTEPGTLINQHM